MGMLIFLLFSISAAILFSEDIDGCFILDCEVSDIIEHVKE